MKIYIVENKNEEMVKAKRVLGSRGHSIVEYRDYAEWFDNMKCQKKAYPVGPESKEEADGVITDMMFHSSPHYKNEAETPSGLLAIIHALSLNLPVVVCSDASEVGGHHSKTLSWIFDGYVGSFWGHLEKCPFGWVEDKNWDKAVELLEQRYAQQKKEVIK